MTYLKGDEKCVITVKRRKDGALRVASPTTAWLHPVAVRTHLDYARDVYLNGYPETVRSLLEPYASALETPREESDTNALELNQLREVTRKIVQHLVSEPPEKTDTLFVELTAEQLEQLEQLNAWDDSIGPNPGDDLRLNLVELGGLFDQLNYLFLGGSAPPPPFGVCGGDPTPDELTCSLYATCE